MTHKRRKNFSTFPPLTFQPTPATSSATTGPEEFLENDVNRRMRAIREKMKELQASNAHVKNTVIPLIDEVERPFIDSGIPLKKAETSGIQPLDENLSPEEQAEASNKLVDFRLKMEIQIKHSFSLQDAFFLSVNSLFPQNLAKPFLARIYQSMDQFTEENKLAKGSDKLTEHEICKKVILLFLHSIPANKIDARIRQELRHFINLRKHDFSHDEQHKDGIENTDTATSTSSFQSALSHLKAPTNSIANAHLHPINYQLPG
jgi:hypothetical protein